MMARLAELEPEAWVRADTADRMRGLYTFRRNRFLSRKQHNGRAAKVDLETQSGAYQRLVCELVQAQRQELVRLRDDNRISDEVLRRVERDLDLEEVRLDSYNLGRGLSDASTTVLAAAGTQRGFLDDLDSLCTPADEHFGWLEIFLAADIQLLQSSRMHLCSVLNLVILLDTASVLVVARDKQSTKLVEVLPALSRVHPL